MNRDTIDPITIDLRRDIDAAIEHLNAREQNSDALVEQYMGESYRDENQPDRPVSFNHAFEFTANLVPSLVMYNPAVSVTSGGMVTPWSDPIDKALGSLIKQIDLVEVLTEIAFDMPFSRGVAMVTLEPTPGTEPIDDPVGDSGKFIMLRPNVARISPKMHFVDHMGGRYSNRRFEGHLFVQHREELLSQIGDDGQPIYDADAMKSIGDDEGMDELRKSLLQLDGVNSTTNDGDYVIGMEVWIRRTNTIHTLAYAKKDDVVEIRQPRPYHGPRRGPYTQFGIYVVPDQLYPLPPLAVTRAMVDSLNRHAHQASMEAETAKRILIFDNTNPQMAAAIRASKSGDSIGVNGYTRGLADQFEFGGPNQQTMAYIAELIQRLDRTSGLNEIIRGRVGTGSTATEIATAARANDARTRFAQEQFRRGVRELLRKIAQVMYETPDVIFPITCTDEATGETYRKMFVGGVAPGQPKSGFESLDIEIEPYSMEYTDQATLQQRAMDAFRIVTETAPLIPQIPYVNWRALIDDLFRPLNIKRGAARYIDFSMVGIMQGFGMMPPGAPGAGGAPEGGVQQVESDGGGEMADSGSQAQSLQRRVLAASGIAS